MLTVCAIYKKENKFLDEWICYHKSIGVQEFKLICNDTDSLSYNILKKYNNIEAWHQYGERNQVGGYNSLIKKVKTKWCAFIDLDEFILPMTNQSLIEIIEEFDKPNIGGVAINWCCYGDSKRTNSPLLQTRDLFLRSDIKFRANINVKCIVRTDKINKFQSHPHVPLFKNNYYCVNENFDRVSLYNNPPSWNKLRINHYVVRSKEDFFLKKTLSKRNNERKTQESFDYHNKNDVYDNLIWIKYKNSIKKFI